MKTLKSSSRHFQTLYKAVSDFDDVITNLLDEAHEALSIAILQIESLEAEIKILKCEAHKNAEAKNPPAA